MDKGELTGHTALCLVALVGFFIYTSSYSLVYHVFKSGATATKPIAVLEMWMVFTHLLSASVTCAVYAVLGVRTADIQTAIFLGIAIAVTACSLACINDAAQCIVFFPAAAWAPLAAAGAIAWSWIVYMASLGCQVSLFTYCCFCCCPSSLCFMQASSITLGASTSHIVAPIIVALFAPSVAATLKQTCGIGAAPQVSLGLHLVLLILAFAIWNGSVGAGKRLPLPSRVLMRALSALLLIVDGFLAVQGIAAWVILVLVGIALSDGQITALLFGTGPNWRSAAAAAAQPKQRQLHTS